MSPILKNAKQKLWGGKGTVKDAKTIAMQVHRKRAAAVIADEYACKWLANRPDVLDELGRIDNEHALLTIAKRICELKPSPPEAIEMIRRHREFDQLADEITHAVNDYVKRHPTTSRRDILRALETAVDRLGRVAAVHEAGRHQFLRKL